MRFSDKQVIRMKVERELITCRKCHDPLTTKVSIASIMKFVLPTKEKWICNCGHETKLITISSKRKFSFYIKRTVSLVTPLVSSCSLELDYFT